MDNIVEQARALAQEVLKDETRYDGSPFLTHPDNVARIVEDEISILICTPKVGHRLKVNEKE